MPVEMPLGDRGEQALVELMLDDQPHWNPFLQLYGTPEGARCFATLPLRPLLPADGDVDVLTVNPGDPQHAIAYQVKKIKVGASSFATQLPNGLASLTKLHQQSSTLVRLGFGRVFSVALVLVDSRSQATENNQYAGLTPNLRQTIDSALALAAPPPGVGFIRIDYTQSFDAPPLHAGMSGIHIISDAASREQHYSVTSWIRNAVERQS